MSSTEKLGPGDVFPELKFRASDRSEFVLPRDIATDYAIVLFYRGHW